MNNPKSAPPQGDNDASDPARCLPPLLAQLAEATSLETALALARACGGGTIWIPAQPQDHHELTQALGSVELAREVARALGPGPLSVPAGRAFAAAELRNRVLAAAARGVSTREIARREGVGVRWVRYLVAAKGN